MATVPTSTLLRLIARTSETKTYYNTTASSSLVTGSEVFNGGIAVAKASSFGGIATFSSGVASTAYGNGALVVSGGGGMSVGAKIFAGNDITAGAALGATPRITVNSSTTGSPLVAWQQNSVDKAYIQYDNTNTRLDHETTGINYFGQQITIAATTASTTIATGALVVAGGVGVAGAMFVGDAVSVASTTASSSTTTGSGIFAGGLGVAGAGNFGGQIKTSFSGSGDYAGYLQNTHASGQGLFISLSGGAAGTSQFFLVANDSGGSNGIFYRNGDWKTATGLYTTFSDRRVKTDFAEIDALSFGHKIRVGRYKNNFNGRNEVGAFAQNVHKYLPEFVQPGTDDDDDRAPTSLTDPRGWAMDYQRFGVVALAHSSQLVDEIRNARSFDALKAALDKRLTM